MQVIFLFVLVSAAAAAAQQVSPPVLPQTTNAPAPPPLPPAPLDFRELINLSSTDRERALAARTPEDRRVIEAKLQEYDALSPEEREMRLRCLQLRLHLRPLMKLPASNRVERLAGIPVEDRELIIKRLKVWDELSPALQKQFLENELAVRALVHPELAVPLRGISPSPQQQALIDGAIAHWKALPNETRSQIHRQFQLIFQLDEKDQAKCMQVLSETERKQMEKTVRVFQGLTQRQRQACVDGLQRFADLSDENRVKFLRNAELWQSMTPQDRRLWRELVGRFRPPAPPTPPTLPPPLPRMPPKVPAPEKTTVLATNN